MRNNLFGKNNITQEEFSSYQILPFKLNNSEFQSSYESAVDGLDEFLALPRARSKTKLQKCLIVNHKYRWNTGIKSQ